MGCYICLIFILVIMVLNGGSCRTIDEMILSAEKHSSQSEAADNAIQIELDMVFGADEYQEMLRLEKEADRGGAQGWRMRRKARRNVSRRWTDNTIPYKITSDFSEADKDTIQEAIDDWNQYTCLNIRPYKSGDDNYILITDGKGCSAFVGMYKGSKNLTLASGCRKKGIILHELGHVLGFWHEHSRPDRDNYIQIMYGSIKDGKEHNFKRHPVTLINSYGVPYDYLSIMHYGKTAFGLNKTQTIRTRDPKYQDLIGNRDGLTFRDIKLANIMYQCARHCSHKRCPGEGFVGKDCNCHCPGNPARVCTPLVPTTTTRIPPTTTAPATTSTPTTTPIRTTSRMKPGVTSADFTLVRGVCQVWGVVMYTAQTESACLRQCAADSECVAVDWYTASNSHCRIHYKGHGACDVFNAPRHKSALCRHHRYTRTSRCEGGSGSSGSGSGWSGSGSGSSDDEDN